MRKRLIAWHDGVEVVAVLLSPGYGAAWSASHWNNSDKREELMFDPVLVRMVLDGRREEITDEFLAQHLGGDVDDYYDGGASDLMVVWVRRGSAVAIGDRDGFERIEPCFVA